ncbi:MAG: hypothetical protein FJ385_02380 [Verrucomicrobia bacterium]|nr:hypothetical protein [Verrucomicrobiota bacterium]
MRPTDPPLARPLRFLGVALSAVVMIQLPVSAADPASSKRRITSGLMPGGSRMDDVLFPRYDTDQQLVSVLKARVLTLVSDQLMRGDEVTIDFLNPDLSARGRVDMRRAMLDQQKNLLSSSEPVTLRNDRIIAKGTGLFYDLTVGGAFLTGPVLTWIAAAAGDPAASMENAASAPLSVPAANAAKPADDGSAAAAPGATEPSIRATLGEALDRSEAANAATREFLKKAELDAATADKPQVPQQLPLPTAPGPDDTVIDCDGGMHYDPDQGVFVYLGNVRVKDPRFDLSGANDLKIFLEPANPTDQDTKPSAPGDATSRMSGEVKRIVATGAVRVLYKDVPQGKQPIEASGALLDYDLKAGRIVISGGYPWVVQGAVTMRAGEPDLSLRIDPNQGKFETSGGDWKTVLPLQQLRGASDR